MKEYNANIVTDELQLVYNDLKDIEPKLASSLIDDIKVIKLRELASDIFAESRKSKGALNRFLDTLNGSVERAQSLREFPELRDFIQLGSAMKSVLRHTNMSDRELQAKFEKVICKDNGTC
jgi:hypothetical protein